MRFMPLYTTLNGSLIGHNYGCCLHGKSVGHQDSLSTELNLGRAVHVYELDHRSDSFKQITEESPHLT